jgi:stearoyl-CoA desaturase (delta-9 desaturase)
MYVIRMFAITAFYHRYFSHRAFKTSRVAQFLFAVLGSASVQKGALWWAAHHRYHHRHADEEADIHSPARHGFWWSHLGWILSDISKPTKWNLVHDFSRYPELRFLDRFYLLVPAVTALSLFGLGSLLEARAPALGTDGWQMLVWGFFVSTFFLFHGTYSINSLAHRFGSRRYRTKDDSRNNRFLAAIALGEGWHNNHHRCPSAARNGFARREIDLTYYGLLFLEKLRIVRDLRPVPPAVLAEGNIS